MARRPPCVVFLSRLIIESRSWLIEDGRWIPFFGSEGVAIPNAFRMCSWISYGWRVLLIRPATSGPWPLSRAVVSTRSRKDVGIRR